MKRTTRMAGGVAAVIALAAALSGTARRARPVEPEAPANRGAPRTLAHAAIAAPAAPPTSSVPRALEEADLIADVVVDNPAPCIDEPVTITLYPNANVDGRALYAIIDGKSGNPAVVAYPSAGRREIPIQMIRRVPTPTADKQIEQRMAVVDVRDCRAEGLRIEAEALVDPAHHGAHALVAEDAGGRPLVVTNATYRWDFGDGDVATTDAPYVEHRFSTRPGAMQTTFVVTLDVARQGRSSRAIGTVSIESARAFNRLHGRVTPDIEVGPTSHEGARYRAVIAVTSDEVMHVDRATLAYVPCDGANAPAPRVLAARDVVDTDAFAPGHHDYAIAVPVRDVPPGMCLVQIDLTGASDDGLPAYASAYLHIADFAPSRTIALDSPALSDADRRTIAELDRAIDVLGRRGDPHPRVTSEEIALLRREGRL